MVVQESGFASLPTECGHFRACAYRCDDASEHLALIMGDVAGACPVLVRVQSECLTGEVFGSLRCDCRDQLALAMREIALHQRGIIIYLRQEGRGIGIFNKIKAYALQDAGADTKSANESLGFGSDERSYAIAAKILRSLDVSSIDLMTNNPAKVASLEHEGIYIHSRVPIIGNVHGHNAHYLDTKRRLFGHHL